MKFRNQVLIEPLAGGGYYVRHAAEAKPSLGVQLSRLSYWFYRKVVPQAKFQTQKMLNPKIV